MKNRTQHELEGFNGALFAEVDQAHSNWNLPGSGWLADGIEPGENAAYVRVISRPGRGQVRAYVLCRGRLLLHGPCYSGRWEEVDAAVAAALGATATNYSVTAGGRVVF